MLVKKTKYGYSSRRKYIQGKGFVDFMRPALQNIGTFISQNKGVIAKPLLGAASDLAAFGLTQGGKALLEKIINKDRNKNLDISPKGVEILQNMTGNNVSNIIGSGIKQF